MAAGGWLAGTGAGARVTFRFVPIGTQAKAAARATDARGPAVWPAGARFARVDSGESASNLWE
jgi:hypothetical protein